MKWENKERVHTGNNPPVFQAEEICPASARGVNRYDPWREGKGEHTGGIPRCMSRTCEPRSRQSRAQKALRP